VLCCRSHPPTTWLVNTIEFKREWLRHIFVQLTFLFIWNGLVVSLLDFLLLSVSISVCGLILDDVAVRVDIGLRFHSNIYASLVKPNALRNIMGYNKMRWQALGGKLCATWDVSVIDTVTGSCLYWVFFHHVQNQQLKLRRIGRWQTTLKFHSPILFDEHCSAISYRPIAMKHPSIAFMRCATMVMARITYSSQLETNGECMVAMKTTGSRATFVFLSWCLGFLLRWFRLRFVNLLWTDSIKSIR